MILAKYDCSYHFCESCGALQTEDPYWLEEAYESPIALIDTGMVWRNLRFSQIVSSILFFLFDRRGKFLDAAGGYGLFTRLMRDAGFDFYWNDKHCENLLVRGFEADMSSDVTYTAVTAFEVLEHVIDPLTFVSDLLQSAGTSTLIFSTELFHDEPPAPDDWWYYCFSTGQHISFYRRSTLEFIGRRLGLKFYSTGMLHIWTNKDISPLALRLLGSAGVSRLISWLPRRIMGSRTWNDHEELLRLRPPGGDNEASVDITQRRPNHVAIEKLK